MRGEAAATVFYAADKMQRKGAVLWPVQQTLTDKDAIHTQDGHLTLKINHIILIMRVISLSFMRCFEKHPYGALIYYPDRNF